MYLWYSSCLPLFTEIKLKAVKDGEDDTVLDDGCTNSQKGGVTVADIVRHPGGIPRV